VGFATLFLVIVLGPYRRGEVWAWWALLSGMVTVSVLIILRVAFLSVQLSTPSAVTGAGTALSSILQLLIVVLGLALDAGRLRRPALPL
jgi:predicted membrane metal-binding protein